jgi:hypothetical protein
MAKPLGHSKSFMKLIAGQLYSEKTKTRPTPPQPKRQKPSIRKKTKYL